VNQYITKILHSTIVTDFQSILLSPCCFETGKNNLSVLFKRIISICFLFFIFFARPVSAAATNAYSFDGGDYASMSNIVADLNGQSAMTISLWAKFTDTSAAHCLFGHTGGKLYFCFDGDGSIGAPGKLIAGQNSGTNANISTNTVTLNDNTWYHFVVVYSASDWTIYVNGVSEPLNKLPFAGTLNGLGSGDFYVGYSSSLGNKFFDGVMDDFQVYNTALDQPAVTNLYGGGSPTEISASATGLIAYWKMNGTATTGASSVIDSQTTGNNAGQLGANTTSGVDDPTTGATGIANGTDAIAPTISAVSIANSDHKVGDTVTATITVTSDTDDYTTGSGAITGTINGYTLGSLSKTNNTTYTATFSITDGGSDVAAGTDVGVNFTLTDSSGNASSAFTTAISQGSDAIYANLPNVDLTASTNTIAEDGGVSTLTATLSGSLNNQWPADVTVNLAYTGTGTTTTDYTKSDSIIIASGNSTNTSTVTGVADTLYDAAINETVIVDINSLSVGSEGSTNQQTLTITDAETAPVVVLTTGSATAVENGGTSTITASLSHATYENVTVNLVYTGTATSGGTDYNTPSSSITITGGSTSNNAATGITAVDDAFIEGNETIIIDVSSVSGGGSSESGTQQKTVTIVDDEDGTAPTISSVSIPNSTHKVGDTVTATITVSSDTDDYTTGSGAITGTINGYTLGSLSKTNNTTYTATFSITDGGSDVAAGTDVGVNFTLTDSSGNASSAFTTAISQGSDAIYANLPNVDLTASTNTIAEDGGVSTLTATLSGSLNNQWPADVTVNLAYTGTGTTTTDYTKSDSIIIASGNSTNTSTVTGVADTLYDAAINETVIVDINSLSVGSEGSTNQQTLTITDAETAPVVVLTTGSATAVENGGTSTITASLSHATYENVTVNLVYTGTATSGGTDYNTPSSSITITGGSTSNNAATGITAVDDAFIEGNETIIIDVSSVSGGGSSESGTQQKTVTIVDDEDGTAPTFDSSPSLSAITSIGANVAVDLNEDGSVYYIVVTDGATVPTAAQVKAAVGYSGITVYASGTINTTSTIGNSTITTLSDGSHYDVYVVAQDNQGNLQADGAVVRLDLSSTDNLPNIASIIISGSPADTATSIDFNIVFSDEVDNVSVDDFTATLVRGETNQAPNITGLTGTGKNYTVSVSTGVTLGDLRLDLNDGTDVIDENSNIPTAYTTGEEHTIDTNNVPTVTEATNNVGPFTLDEDIKTALDLTDLVITDANNDTLTLTLSVNNGLLFASDGNSTVLSTTISNSDENGTTSLTLTGLSADITSFFDDDERIKFQTDANETSAVTFTISADDDLEVSTVFTETLTINAINDAPTISGTPVTSIIDGNTYNFTPTANDIENDTPLVFSIINKPTWASFDTATGKLSGDPTPAHVGITSNIVIRVEDPSSAGNDLAAFNVEIVASNNAPQISQGNSVLVNMSEDSSPTAFSLSLDASDANNDNLTWTISSAALNGSAVATGSGNNKTISYIPTSNYHGNDSFIVSVSDGLSIDTITVNVVLASVNDLPLFSSSGSTSIAEDSHYVYSISATDLDDTSLMIVTTMKPSWLTLTDNGNGSANLTGTPSNADIGNNNITLKVSDDEGGSSLQSFTISVTNTNDAPIISGVPATEVQEDSAYNFTPTVTDVDSGDTLTFSITNKPSWASFNSGTGALIGTPDNNDIGATSNIIIAVADAAGVTASLAAYSLTVTNTNDAPIISGAPATEVQEDSAYNFTPTVTDVDSGDTLTFSITNKPSWATFNSGTGALIGTPDNNDIGATSNIIIAVADAAGATASLAAYSLTVINTNDAPIISGAPATEVQEDSAYNFTPTVTDEDESDTHTFSLSGNPEWMQFDEAIGKVSGTPTQDDVGVTSDITITVNDNSGAVNATASIKFSVLVGNVNQAPEAVADTFTLNQNTENTYILNVLNNDSDLDGDVISITGASTSNGSVIHNGENLTVIAQAGFLGQIKLVYTITDGNGTFVDGTVELLINGELNGSAPIITVPETVEVNATGLYTKVDLGIATAVNSEGQPIAISLVDGDPLFRPGNHIAYWQATDQNTGLTTVASQAVIVHPIISLGKDQLVVEGKVARVEVILNGEAPTYPLIITLNIVGDDSDYLIASNQVVIKSGTQAHLKIDIVQDNEPEDDETLTLSLDDGNIGSKASHVMTIVEKNIAPSVTLMSVQNNEARQVVTSAGGLVTVEARVTDANDDNVTTLWTYDYALNVTPIDDNTITLDPSELDIGVYRLGITATDTGDGNLSTTKSLYIAVVENLVELSNNDTDGDRIPDNEEGYGDADQDGIPDFLDAIAECNVMPEQAAVQDGFLVEGEPGICLRKGNTLSTGETGGLQLTSNDLENSIGVDDEAVIVGGVFDYIATGLPEAGQNYQIVLPQLLPIPTDAVYRKYSENMGWGMFVEDVNNQLHSSAGTLGYCPPPASILWTSGLTEGHWCVQLTLEDGGPNDNDGIANGTIIDPGGVFVLLTNNTIPVAQADSVRVKRNQAIVIDVLANDTDADQDILRIGVASATFGTVLITADNQLDYQSADDFIGQDTLIYSISDGNGGTDSSTVSITVYANSAPVALDDNANTNDRSNVIIDVLANDSDADGDNLTVVSATVDNGEVMINTDNSLTYKPDNGFDGIALITYTLDDGQGEQATAQVMVTVNAFNTVTVKNKSKGGSLGGMLIVLTGMALYRLRRQRNIKTKYFLQGAAALTVATSMNLAAAEPQWFMTGSFGKSHANSHVGIPSDIGITDSDLDKSGTSYTIGGGVSYGVYSFTVNYEQLGDSSASYTGDTLDTALFHQTLVNVAPKLVDGISLQGQYTLWQDDALSASIGAGLFAWELDYTSKLNDSVIKVSKNDVDFIYNLQVAYAVTAQVQVSLKASRYSLSVNDINNIALGLTYHF
jgi:hypothetical protein